MNYFLDRTWGALGQAKRTPTHGPLDVGFAEQAVTEATLCSEVSHTRMSAQGKADTGLLDFYSYRARARTRVMSSGCSLSPIQSSTAEVTSSVISVRGSSRFSRTRSIKRCSPNSPKSFSGSVTPSL